MEWVSQLFFCGVILGWLSSGTAPWPLYGACGGLSGQQRLVAIALWRFSLWRL